MAQHNKAVGHTNPDTLKAMAIEVILKNPGGCECLLQWEVPQVHFLCGPKQRTVSVSEYCHYNVLLILYIIVCIS